ncbi:MAG: ribonuclease H-like domain-containing protein [Candidatus Hodarchaeota archaeon]
MGAPVWKLKKADIVWLSRHKCNKHNHSYLEHYSCYEKEHPERQKIGFIDIETFSWGFHADQGLVLCYCIKPQGESKIIGCKIKPKEVTNHRVLDKRVLIACVNDMRKFDLLVGFNSTLFDMSFLRVRSMMQNVKFPLYGEINHKDVWYLIRGKFYALSRKSLERSCKTLVGETEKNHLNFYEWLRAVQGDTKMINKAYDHCERDVRDLERLYDRTIEFQKGNVTSI